MVRVLVKTLDGEQVTADEVPTAELRSHLTTVEDVTWALSTGTYSVTAREPVIGLRMIRLGGGKTWTSSSPPAPRAEDSAPLPRDTAALAGEEERI